MTELKGSLMPGLGLYAMDTALNWYRSDHVEYSPSLRYGLHIAQEGKISNVSYTIKDEDDIRYRSMHMRVTVMDFVDRKFLTSIKIIDLTMEALPDQLAILTYYWIDDSEVMLVYVDGQHLIRVRMELNESRLLLDIVEQRSDDLLFWYGSVKRMCSSPVVSIEDKKYVVPMAFSSVILIIPFEMSDEHPVTLAFNEGFLDSANWALSREGNVYFPVDPVYAAHVFLKPIRTPSTVVYRLNLSLLSMQQAFYEDVLEVPNLLSVVRFYGEKAESIMQYANCGTSHSGCYMLKYKKPEVAQGALTSVEVFNSIPRNIRKDMVHLSSSSIPTIYGNSLLIWTSGLFEHSDGNVFKDKTQPKPMTYVVLPGWRDRVCEATHGINNLDFSMAMFSPASEQRGRDLACLQHITERFLTFTAEYSCWLCG